MHIAVCQLVVCFSWFLYGPQRMLNQLVTAIAIQSDLLLKVFPGLKVSHFKVSHIATVRLKYSRDVLIQ